MQAYSTYDHTQGNNAQCGNPRESMEWQLPSLQVPSTSSSNSFLCPSSTPFEFERRPTMGLQRTPTYTSNFPIQRSPVPLTSYPNSMSSHQIHDQVQQQQQQIHQHCVPTQQLRPNTSYIVNGPGWDNCPPHVNQQQQQYNAPQTSFFMSEYAQQNQPFEMQPNQRLCEKQKEFISFNPETPKPSLDITVTSVSPQQPSEQNYCDITEYLNMPQTKAAKLLGIPTSTLSKRWKEAAPQRKWPWRTTCKIDKQIAGILQEIPRGGEIPLEDRDKLALLIRKRQEELRPIVIRF